MRIPGRKVYRAFKELDQFPDDRCVRFVAAANRGWVRMTVGAALMLAVGVAVLLSSMWLLLYTTGDMDRKFGFGIEYYLVMIPIWVLGLSAGPVAALVTRDVILKRRLRRIIRLRGTCRECGYSLMGLPIREDLAVVCSECGAETVVDRAFGELVLDELGRARFSPKEGGLSDEVENAALASVREAKRRKQRRTMWIVMASAMGIVIVAVLGREYMLRRDAEMARREAAAMRLQWNLLLSGAISGGRLSGSSGGSRGGVNGWDVVLATAERYRNLKPQMFVDERGQEQDPRTFVGVLTGQDWSRAWLRGENDQILPSYQMEQILREQVRRAKVDALLDELERAGFFAALDAADLNGKFRIALPVGKNQSLASMPFVEIYEAMQVGRLCLARMDMATERRDLEGFLRAANGAMVVAAALERVPLFETRSGALWLQSLFFRMCSDWLACCPTAHEIDALTEFVGKLAPIEDLSFACMGERLRSVDAIAAVFQDPSNVRWGVDAKKLPQRYSVSGFPDSLNVWEVGSYSVNRDAMIQAWATAEWHARTPWWSRVASGFPWRRMPLVNRLHNDPEDALFERERVELRRRAVIQALCIERFRLEHGRYPFADEFENGEAGAIQRDVFSGKPLRYIEFRRGEVSNASNFSQHPGIRRLIDQGGYLLLSAGADKSFDFDTRRLVLSLDEMWTTNTPGFDVLLTPVSVCP